MSGCVLQICHIFNRLSFPSTYVIARRIFDGGVGNFAHFEDCLFLRNRATEYAGAVGLILPSANAIFDSRDAIVPFEFRNWQVINTGNYCDCI